MSETEAHHQARARLEAAIGGTAELIEIGRRLDSLRPFLVGGAVRDLLLDLPVADIDVVVEGDAADAAGRLAAGEGEVVTHPRFNTATCEFRGHRVDLAGARTETYASAGALPDVDPATVERDLARRDFSINAMAVSLDGDAQLLDPCGGVADLEARLLRVLHDDSFRDDPTRVIRGARYAVRLGLSLAEGTATLLPATPFRSVSADRLRGELLRAAGEPQAAATLRLLAEWGAVDLADSDDLLDRLAELGRDARWSGFGDGVLPEALLVAGRVRCGSYEAAGQPLAAATELAVLPITRPSQGVEAAAGADAVTLLLARALGATWLDDYVASWRSVALAVGPGDLLAAGVPRGPELTRGLGAARRALLDGEAPTRELQLEAALAELRR